jgi:menaquinone-9 beta-reductase
MSMYDVVIVGGGPAGSTAAMYFKNSGKKVILLDKANFPRDKTCGDAQGNRAAAIIEELGIYEEYEKLEGQKIYGITTSSPNGKQVHLDVAERDKEAPGYVHTRMIFDNFLFENAKKCVETRTVSVIDVIVEDNYVKGVLIKNEKGENEEIRSKLVLASDGALSVVARKFGLDKNPPEHFIAAIRAYYKNVDGMTDRIEIHMIKNLIPGYFWIFPLPNNEANVGLGMIIKDMKEKKINLKEAMLKEIQENPLFKERFKGAELQGDIKGWNLPIASYHRKCYGNGFMLLGDAASLIDPLSGEGISNSMISGKVAVEVAKESLEKGDFSEEFLKKYDEILWGAIGEQIQYNFKLQKLSTKFPFLIDKVVEKALKDEEFRKKVQKMLPYTSGRKELSSTGFITSLDSSLNEEDLSI